MKLTSATITTLDNLLQTLNTIGIAKVIIEPKRIRAIDEKNTVGTITDQNVPDLSGKTLAVNRIKNLKDRLNLAKAQGDVEINTTDAQSGDDISMLQVVAGRSKSQFRCAASESVKVPKTLNDKPAYTVLLSSKLIPLIVQANASMATDHVTIASKNGLDISIELIDATKDVYTFDVEKQAEVIGATKASSFCHKYTSVALLSLLREAMKTQTNEVKVTIGNQGILFVDVNGYNFFTLPHA